MCSEVNKKIAKNGNEQFHFGKRKETCPRCGSPLDPEISRPVLSHYPAPVLEVFECVNEKCRYHRYGKVGDF